MNEYVAGGWGATAALLALYTWRVIHRGRVLTRALPQPAEVPPPESPSAEVRSWH